MSYPWDLATPEEFEPALEGIQKQVTDDDQTVVWLIDAKGEQRPQGRLSLGTLIVTGSRGGTITCSIL